VLTFLVRQHIWNFREGLFRNCYQCRLLLLYWGYSWEDPLVMVLLSLFLYNKTVRPYLTITVVAFVKVGLVIFIR
jgi:hypothetical protein